MVCKQVRYMIDRNNGFSKDCDPDSYYYNDDEEVSFELKTVGTYKYAIKTRPTKEY